MNQYYDPYGGALNAVFGGMQQAQDFNRNELANLINEQRLNKSRLTDPLDIVKELYEAKFADAKMDDPNYIPWQLKGMMGQMMSQDAAGRRKQATYDSDVELDNKTNKNKISTEDFLAQLNDLKRQQLAGFGGGSGQIGFNMGQSEADSDIQGLFIGDQDELNRTYDTIRRIKDPQERKDAMSAWKNSGAKYTGKNTIGMNWNDSTMGNGQQPLRNGGLMPGNAQYEATMNALVDTPANRAALIKGDQKYDSAEYLLNMRIEADVKKAQLRQVFERSPKTAEEFMMKMNVKIANGETLTKEETTAFDIASQTLMAKAASAIPAGINPEVAPNVLTPFVPKPSAPTLGNKKPKEELTDQQLLDKWK